LSVVQEIKVASVEKTWQLRQKNNQKMSDILLSFSPKEDESKKKEHSIHEAMLPDFAYPLNLNAVNFLTN